MAVDKDVLAVGSPGGGLPRSIYDMYSPLRRILIIFTAAYGFLLSFCGAMYLPALKVSSPHGAGT